MINLTIKEGSHELLDGFPETISFETDVPSTVYYTLDGTDPTADSLIAVGKIFLPTLKGSLTVRAIAMSGDDESEIIEAEYENSSTKMDGRRLIGDEGIAVIRFGDDLVDSLAFDSDGGKAQGLSGDKEDFDIKGSRTSSRGEAYSAGKTSRDFINFSLKDKVTKRDSISSPNNNPNFDPTAKFIVIDGSTEEAKDNQVVKIVNRPYNTFGTTTNFYKERLGQKEPIITGNFVRSFYNGKTGKYVSYYWESLESRWIRSEQTISRDTLRIGPKAEKLFVYRWIQDRALSQLF